MPKYMTPEHARGVKELGRLNICTMADVDARRGNNSRFGFVRDQVGMEAAMWVFNDLALCQCIRLTGGP